MAFAPMTLTTTEVEALRHELARAQIRDAMFRYCRGVDRGDLTLILSSFHPGALEDHGPYRGPIEPFAATLVKIVPDTILGIQHCLGNMLVEFSDDSASVETYFQATYRDKLEPEMVSAFGGRYLDRFEKRHEEWRIARRTVVNDWSYRVSQPVDAAGTIGYHRGSVDRHDPVYLSATWSAASG